MPIAYEASELKKTTAKDVKRDYERRRKKRERNQLTTNPAVVPAQSSFMAGEQADRVRDLTRRLQAGHLLSEDEFYEWAQGRRLRPNYENYLKFVAKRRGLGKDAGVEALASRAVGEAANAEAFSRDMNPVYVPEENGSVLLSKAAVPWNQQRLRDGQIDPEYEREMKVDVGRSNPFPFLSWLGGETKDLFTETIPNAVMDMLPDSAPGTSIRIGQNQYGFVPPDNDITGLAAIPAAGLESETAGLVGELSQVPKRLISQPIEAAVYTPAFVHQLVTDPIGTVKQIPEAIIEDFRHPLQNAGYLAMDLLGARGAAMGGLRRGRAFAGAETSGDRLRALTRPIDRGSRTLEPGVEVTDLPTTVPRALTDRLPWNTHDREVGRGRARTREVDAELRAADAAALERDTRRLSDAEGIAVHAVGAQVEPMELAAMWAERRKTTTRDAVRDNLDRAIQAASDIDQLGILIRDAEGRLAINPEYQRGQGITSRIGQRLTGRGRPSLAGITERTRMVSRADEETKIGLGELDPETARRHIDDVGAFVRGDDVVPGERLRLNGQGVPEPLPQGEFYTYLGEEKPGIVSNFTPKLSGKTLGVTRTPVLSSNHAWTGGALANATFDLNAPRVTAQRALAMVRERARLDAYETAKTESITAKQLIDQIDGMTDPRKAMELRHWNAVRVVTGANETATTRFLDRLFADDSLFARIDKDRLDKLAADADAMGQVRFFDNRRVRMNPVRLPNEGAVRQSIDAVTQAAKFSLLFTKLTGYATPQVIGQTGMALIGMGLHGSLEFGGKAATWWRQFTPHERATLQAGRGGGIAPSMQFERGPIPALRKLNSTAASLYGVVIDSPFRTSSFLYHANSKGYTKLADVKRLLNAKEGTREWQHLREIRDLVDEDFGRFSTLTGAERELARYVFFYPWLRASTLYAMKLPRNHPVKTMLLVQGGRNAREDTEQGLAQLIERIADESPERAQALATEIMRMNPGLFFTGKRDAQGNPEVVAPQSAAVLQGPHDLLEAVGAVTSGEPERLLRMGTPGVSLAAAALNYDTFQGRSYPQGTGLDERVTEELAGYVPFVTLNRRLSGKQGKTFTYTDEQAWKQTFQGSQSARGLNVEGAVEVASRNLPPLSAQERSLRDAKETMDQYLLALQQGFTTEENPKIAKQVEAGRLPPDLQKALTLDLGRRARIAIEEEKTEAWDDLPAEGRALKRLRWTLDYYRARDLIPAKTVVAMYQDYKSGKSQAQIDGFIGRLVRDYGGGQVTEYYKDILRAQGWHWDGNSREFVYNTPDS